MCMYVTSIMDLSEESTCENFLNINSTNLWHVKETSASVLVWRFDLYYHPAVTPTAACVTRKPHSRARSRLRSDAYPKRWHLWTCTAFGSERADRFIKHSLIATNQLNWIVWAQCFNDRRCREGRRNTYGLHTTQDGHEEDRGERRKGVGETNSHITTSVRRRNRWKQHRTFVFFVVSRNGRGVIHVTRRP